MGNPTILIVEDEGIVAIDVKRYVEKLGYLVTGIVRTGEDAVKAAASQKPDLILMDISLPGKMNGLQAADEVWRKHGIPVIFLTAYRDKVPLRQATCPGSLGMFQNPSKGTISRLR